MAGDDLLDGMHTTVLTKNTVVLLGPLNGPLKLGPLK